MISGGVPSDIAGKSVEVYVPSTGQQCQLPSLPDIRHNHGAEAMTVFGGCCDDDIKTSCQTLTDGSWGTTTTLLENR